MSAGIWVIHTEVANLGARWSRFLTVTLMMVWDLATVRYHALGAYAKSVYLVVFLWIIHIQDPKY